MTEKNKYEIANQAVSMIMDAVQGGTAKETADRNMADRLDISDVLPYINTKGWSDGAQNYLSELYKIVKGYSLDTRHDMKLSFPPSDYSKTDDPVSLTYESCYKAVSYYTALIMADPELRQAFIDAMAERGINEDNYEAFMNREWDIWAYMLSLPQMAALTKAHPEYEDFNQRKVNNKSLISAKRKIEHMTDGALVEKVSIDNYVMKDKSGKVLSVEIADTNDLTEETENKVFAEECLSLLSDEDRQILIRHANGETYALLAEAFGYKTAGGMQKRVERIKKQITEKISQ